ncbi:uncharacterized protein LOC116192701 [Punica granatum]|uniref:Uncharacterized protein LOC116192678 n=2 Tax=Punica granatum TaxID=22663 RepID=A0A6P8C3B6_PUNGR|nr:uncharacterized protein LOC116192678 [Punica granatum]XP_031377175.1 uncharacterized protein LOC116192701 [Punica granatum]OWM63289.1 hypothetical protein CDL15_Pgr022034 [Punica granatum]PKI38680.1 hypothetical protein CRG98_040917 [Punica granatum]
MDELRNIAKDYIEDADEDPSFMALVLAVFCSMSENGNGSVTYEGFHSYMLISGFSRINHRIFFEQLDRDGDHKLDLLDVATFCLLCFGGRPICAGCSSFVPGDQYLTCLACFLDSNTPFNLCPTCHYNIRQHLDHDHLDDYIDNFAMIELLRYKAIATKKHVTNAEMEPSMSREIAQINSVTGSSTAIAPARERPQKFHWRDGFTLAQLGIALANVIIAICSLL